MIDAISHHEGGTSSEVTGTVLRLSPSVIKLGVDVHALVYVVVAQFDHATPKPARRFTPGEFVPWVERLRREGHAVHVVYEACGFGFGLYRALENAGAHGYVIAPQKLDEQRTGVKTDARDAATLCQRLSRYLEGNTRELAVIRVPTEEEEQRRHVHRQREALVRVRTKLQAQGRGLLVNHGRPAPPHWWRQQTWDRLGKVLPDWLNARLEVLRPLLSLLDEQLAALSRELEAAAPPDLPRGLGKLTSVVLSREVCDWTRFQNRRQVASYTGLCPGEHSSGNKRVPGSVTKHGNPRLRASLVELAWRLVRFQPDYPPVQKRLALLAKGARATGAQRKKAIDVASAPPFGLHFVQSVSLRSAVAVARHLAVDLWRLHTGQCTATQLGLTLN